jgi:uncharacterized protein (TIGR01244 family)
MDTITIDDRFTVGPQPDREGLFRLAKMGFKTIINLRTDGENEEILAPEEEGQQVRRLGMRYVWYPIPRYQPMRPEWVGELRNKAHTLPMPIYIHCRWGKRASALIWTVVALERRLSGNKALAAADRMGLTATLQYRWRPRIRKFVCEYLDRALLV